jgi:hypothetical protein
MILWNRFLNWQNRILVDCYSRISQWCFGTAIFLLVDGYSINLLGSYLSDSTEVMLSYLLLFLAYLSLHEQVNEDHVMQDKFAMQQRNDFLRKERVVSDIKTNIARDLVRERQSGSKLGRYSIGHKDAVQ